MGRYDRFQHKEKIRPEINPIWRGMGCIFMVVVPLVTYALTTMLIPILLDTGYVPYELLGHIIFPAWVYRLPFLSGVTSFFGGINNLYLDIIVFMVILVLLSGVFSLIYVAILQVVGPPRYTEIDAPPSRHKGKAYKR